MAVARLRYDADSSEVENMSQVCNIRHKIRCDEAAAFGEQISVCTSLGVTNVLYYRVESKYVGLKGVILSQLEAAVAAAMALALASLFA